MWRTYRITDIPAGRMGPKLVNLYISETTDKYILDRENLKKLSCRIERDQEKETNKKRKKRNR